MKKFLERSFVRHPVATVTEICEPAKLKTPDDVAFNSASTDGVVATMSVFPQAICSITTLIIPPSPSDGCSTDSKAPRKSLFDEMLEVENIPSMINKKLRKRRKSSAKSTTRELEGQKNFMGKLLTKSLNAQSDLKALKATLSDIEINQEYISSKVRELKGRIDSLYQLTSDIEKSQKKPKEPKTNDMVKAQKVLKEECYELLLELHESGWTVEVEEDYNGNDKYTQEEEEGVTKNGQTEKVTMVEGAEEVAKEHTDLDDTSVDESESLRFTEWDSRELTSFLY